MAVQRVSFQFDPLTEEASITIGGETFELCFDLAALRLFYRTWGVNPAIEPIGTDPARWASLLWVGLLAKQPEFDPEVVKRWFTGASIAELMIGTRSAFLLSLPEPKPGEGPETENPPSA